MGKYSRDNHEEQKYYQHKFNEEVKDSPYRSEYNRNLLSSKEERKSRPSTHDWIHDPANYEYSNADNEESHTYNGQEQQIIESVGNDIENGGGPDFNKSNRAKRQKWNKKPNSQVLSTNINQKVNARTVAQMERIESITNDANKQEAIINKIYEKVQEDKRINRELKISPNNKKERRKAGKPNLVPQNPALFSADQWLSNIGGSDIEEHKERIGNKKKANAAKVASVVDRLSKPNDKNKLRRDPDEEEIKYIMNKYDTSEKRIGGGAKKKFEYRNQLPDQMAANMVPQKSVSFAPEYSQISTKDDNENEIDEQIQRNMEERKMHINQIQSNHKSIYKEEETKTIKHKKQQETITTLKSQLATNKVSEHYTLIDNAMKEINGDVEKTQDYSEFPEYTEDHEEEQIDFNERDVLPTLQIEKFNNENLEIIKERTIEIDADESKEHKQLLIAPSRNSNIRSSRDSLNDRASQNKDFITSEDQSDYNERDIDLEEQYNNMIQKEGNNGDDLNEQNSEADSINDVAMRFF